MRIERDTPTNQEQTMNTMTKFLQRRIRNNHTEAIAEAAREWRDAQALEVEALSTYNAAKAAYDAATIGSWTRNLRSDLVEASNQLDDARLRVGRAHDDLIATVDAERAERGQ